MNKTHTLMNAKPDSGKCETVVQHKMSMGVLGKGTESFRTVPAWCANNAAEGDTVCKRHRAIRTEITRKLEAKKSVNTKENK